MLKSNHPDTRAAVELLFRSRPGARLSPKPGRSGAGCEPLLLGKAGWIGPEPSRFAAWNAPEAGGGTTVERAEPQRLLKLRREHWDIVNRLHWAPDAAFGEDDCPAPSSDN